MEKEDLENKIENKQNSGYVIRPFKKEVEDAWRAGCIANRVVSLEANRQFRINFYKKQDKIK